MFHTWLGDHVNVHMADKLVSNATIVLQHIVVLDTLGLSDLLGDRQQVGQVLIRYVVQALAVVFGNYERVAFGNRTDAVKRAKGQRRLENALPYTAGW